TSPAVPGAPAGTAPRGSSRLLVLLGAVAAAPTVLGLLVGLVVGVPVIGLLVGLVIGLAVVALAWWRAEPLTLSLTGARPADPVEHARLLNLLDGLCAASGLTRPAAFVVADAAPNALALGRSPRSAAVVVTEGLLAQLRRVELEAVLAHELSHVKDGATALRTVAVPLIGVPATVLPAGPAGRLRHWVVGEAEAPADLAAVAITRYPPGLASALEVVASTGGRVATPPAVAHLWLAPPLGAFPASPGEGLPERVAFLREL
ncbi:MAG: Zn-dependent protease with chaperone function, partial [Acidimicrobiales bacterium]|nr:Zn-dependent protease with chaperone function [Acidimicrobiales bacterium]